MSVVLLVGVSVAAVLVAAGGAMYLARYGGQTPDYGTFLGPGGAFPSIGAILHGVRALEPAALIALGLVILVLTPVARVVFALLAFAAQRDRLYMIFTLIVLAVLAIGLTGHSL